MTPATTSALLSQPDAAVFEKNLSTLIAYQPEVADRLRRASVPATLCFTRGRDDAPTFVWTDAGDRSHWLGRTTIPTVRAQALVDAFNAGDGNILLAGFGQGSEVDLLRQRLAPHQAIMVVEENLWEAVCVLRLYDFSAELRNGRLHLFVGSEAWKDLERFLLANDGYMEPMRILSWPWFDAAQVAEVSQRLTTINARLAAHRAARAVESTARKTPAKLKPTMPVVAIVSTIPDQRIRRAAEVIGIAAESLGWKAEKFVLNSPARVHPLGVRRALGELGPSLCLLLDVIPSMLPYTLPEAPAFVLCTHAEPLSEQWLAQLGATVRLGVVNESQREQAIRCGIAEASILVVLPAAQSGLAASDRPARSTPAGPLVVADRIDPSSEAAGLHLASHRRLWDAATNIIMCRCDEYDDDQAADILAAAEKQFKIRIASEEVRAGLIDRIQWRLGPATIRSAYLTTLHHEIGSFDLYGSGWEHDSLLVEHHRGHWPPPDEVPAVLSRYRTMVVFNPIVRPHEPLLDGLAAGLTCMFRAFTAKSDTILRRADLPEVSLSRNGFTSRTDLVKRLRRADAQDQENAASLSLTINARHTWVQRLQSIAQFCKTV